MSLEVASEVVAVQGKGGSQLHCRTPVGHLEVLVFIRAQVLSSASSFAKWSEGKISNDRSLLFEHEAFGLLFDEAANHSIIGDAAELFKWQYV